MERSKIESKTQELALMPGKDTDAKLGVLRLKREALEKKKPSWQSIARPMAMLVRYPFIAPELLNYSIAENGDFQVSSKASQPPAWPPPIRAVA